MTRHAFVPLLLLATALSSLAGSAPAQAPGESLIAPIPAGFEYAGQMVVKGSTLKIYRPPGQTNKNWSDQIVLQTTPTKVGGEPVGLLHAMEKPYADACKEHAPITILPGKTNGYATATTLFKCPAVADTGKPETALMHAIGGVDALYLVQQTVRYVPAPEQLKQMIAYLGTMSLCDSRTAEHPCPPDAKP